MGAGPVPDVDLQALEGPDAAWNLGHSVAAWQQSCLKTGGAMHRNPFLVGGLVIMIPTDFHNFLRVYRYTTNQILSADCGFNRHRSDSDESFQLARTRKKKNDVGFEPNNKQI